MLVAGVGRSTAPDGEGVVDGGRSGRSARRPEGVPVLPALGPAVEICEPELPPDGT